MCYVFVYVYHYAHECIRTKHVESSDYRNGRYCSMIYQNKDRDYMCRDFEGHVLRSPAGVSFVGWAYGWILEKDLEVASLAAVGHKSFQSTVGECTVS